MITTRNANLATAIGASICKVPLMTTDESVELLTKWGGEKSSYAPHGTKIATIDERLGQLAIRNKAHWRSTTASQPWLRFQQNVPTTLGAPELTTTWRDIRPLVPDRFSFIRSSTFFLPLPSL
ncbi:MAG: hypothetical protein IPK16_21120 [Anaerolineales bacterium]|nr:hypothetical protein [Anaerolineales bacterium]